MTRLTLLDVDDASALLALPPGLEPDKTPVRVEWRRADRDEWTSFAASSSVFRKRNLESGAPYVFRVAPPSSSADADPDDELRWTQPESRAASGIPPAPTVAVELSGADPSTCSATARWTDPNPTSSRYEVQFFVKDVTPDWVTATDSATSTAVRKRNLPAGPGGVVFFRWRGFTDKGWGAWSHASDPATAPAPALALVRALGAPTLESHTGAVHTASLAGKVVALYFSAHWCPPCRMFTPQLIEYYNTLRSLGKPFEVVFVSADHSAHEFASYFKTMPWLAIPFDSRARETVPEAHGVRGIPALHILAPDTGKIVDQEARSRPLNAATFDHWASLCGV